jgi:hypothetical protein
VLVFAVQVIKGFAAKSDGKDKLTALVQVCAILTATKPAAAVGAVFHNPAAEKHSPANVLHDVYSSITLATDSCSAHLCVLLRLLTCLFLLQYLCLFLSAGQPGQLKKVQASVTAARKVFRIMRVSSGSSCLGSITYA